MCWPPEELKSRPKSPEQVEEELAHSLRELKMGTISESTIERLNAMFSRAKRKDIIVNDEVLMLPEGGEKSIRVSHPALLFNTRYSLEVPTIQLLIGKVDDPNSVKLWAREASMLDGLDLRSEFDNMGVQHIRVKSPGRVKALGFTDQMPLESVLMGGRQVKAFFPVGLDR